MKFTKVTEFEVYDQNNKNEVEDWTWFACARLDVVSAEDGKEYEVKYRCALNTQNLPNLAKKNEAKKLIETIKPIYLAAELEAAGFTVVSKKPIERYNTGW